MKKILLATSILAATTGFAAAEVAVSGNGRMGVVYDGTNVQFSNRIRVIFTMTGETDTGLAFGASIRADNSGGGNSGGFRDANGGNEGSIFISGAFGKLEMGNVASAAEAVIGDLSGVGYTGLGDASDMDYLVQDGADIIQGPSALYTYSVNDLTFAASMTDGSIGVADALGNYSATDTDTAYSLAVGYAAGDYKVGLGYSKRGDADQIALGGAATFGSTTVKAVYLTTDSDAPNSGVDIVGLSGDFAIASGPTLTAFYKNYMPDVGDDFAVYGIGAKYDLGGGATFAAGIVDTDVNDGDPIADVGLTFAF